MTSASAPAIDSIELFGGETEPNVDLVARVGETLEPSWRRSSRSRVLCHGVPFCCATWPRRRGPRHSTQTAPSSRGRRRIAWRVARRPRRGRRRRARRTSGSNRGAERLPRHDRHLRLVDRQLGELDARSPVARPRISRPSRLANPRKRVERALGHDAGHTVDLVEHPVDDEAAAVEGLPHLGDGREVAAHRRQCGALADVGDVGGRRGTAGWWRR